MTRLLDKVQVHDPRYFTVDITDLLYVTHDTIEEAEEALALGLLNQDLIGYEPSLEAALDMRTLLPSVRIMAYRGADFRRGMGWE